MRSKIHDWGIVTDEAIDAEDFVIEYIGQVIRRPVSIKGVKSSGRSMLLDALEGELLPCQRKQLSCYDSQWGVRGDRAQIAAAASAGSLRTCCTFVALSLG